MREPYRKGVASHPDPESCVASRKVGREALTGAHAGWVSSCEIIATRVPTQFNNAEGNTGGHGSGLLARSNSFTVLATAGSIAFFNKLLNQTSVRFRAAQSATVRPA